MEQLTSVNVATAVTIANTAASFAAQEWLDNATPRYEIVSNGYVVNQLLDVCGFAYIKFSDRRSRDYKAFLRAGACDKDGTIKLKFALQSRQEHGLHVAACQAAQSRFVALKITGTKIQQFVD